jgi:site-specific recombinase XerD
VYAISLLHYRLHELTRERKAFSTIESHRVLCKRYIEPRWGQFRLCAVRTIHVEEWLHSLALAPSSKAKLKSILSALYNHAIRYEWLTFNPLSRVRTSSKRLRDKDVLTPKSSSVLRSSSMCATGQWYCLPVALVYADRK